MAYTIDHLTLSNSRAFSMIMRSLCCDSRELAGLLGAKNFFSFSFATNWGSKFMNTSLWSAIACEFVLGHLRCFAEKLISWVLCLIWLLYLKVSLLLRIAGHAISASAPDRVSISNSFLQFRTKNCNFSIPCWSYISKKQRLADLIRFRAYLSSCTGTPHSWSWKAA